MPVTGLPPLHIHQYLSIASCDLAVVILCSSNQPYLYGLN